MSKHFFDTDNDGHWYLIPSEWRKEWNELSEDDDCWEKDEWQKFEDCRLDGGISGYDFEIDHGTL